MRSGQSKTHDFCKVDELRQKRRKKRRQPALPERPLQQPRNDVAMDSTVQPTILAHVSLPVGEAQIVEWQWPSPLDVLVREDRHMIEMSLPPLAADGSACFPEIAPKRFSYLGNIFLRPAGVMIRARSPGGHIQTVRLTVDQHRYEDITGYRIEPTEAALRVCLDLRGDRARALLQAMHAELSSPGLASAALLEAYGTAVMIETARSVAACQEHDTSQGRLAGWQYRRVCDRINTEGPPPTLAELAGLCGISVRHFMRLYRALTGESATTHIERAQIDRAKAYLMDTGLPLKEVSARLGFAQPGSFSTAFRRATGLTPRQFRQKHRI